MKSLFHLVWDLLLELQSSAISGCAFEMFSPATVLNFDLIRPKSVPEFRVPNANYLLMQV
jgi:hypothetical protein